MENFTEKYNLKIFCDQFGQRVVQNYFDASEHRLISIFEKEMLKIRGSKDFYTMIELGSNQAYYSCLFKAILGKSNTKNIMVEPLDHYMQRGKYHFNINSYDGIFLDYCIGDQWGENGELFLGRLPTNTFNKVSKTLEQIMEEVNIQFLDVLHSDIDGSEHIMLTSSKNIFKNKMINSIFLLTHGADLNNRCKTFLLECGYNLIHEADNIGGDGLLVFEK